MADEENQLVNAVDKFQENEVKLILGCLHPDKHEGNPRYAKAFEAFRRVYGRK